MLTMLLGGLWHGASWNFVIWGGLHGIFLAVERLIRQNRGQIQEITNIWVKLFLGIFTYFLVNITWVFFRADDLSVSMSILSSMFGFAPVDAKTPLPILYIVEVVVVILGLVTAHWLMRSTTIEAVYSKMPSWLVTAVLVIMAFMVIITQGSGNAFIYFQF
jgi:alginate O-acetyltransferase complex protein AlgI